MLASGLDMEVETAVKFKVHRSFEGNWITGQTMHVYGKGRDEPPKQDHRMSLSEKAILWASVAIFVTATVLSAYC